jgi:dienelactone hydrolase
VADAGDLPCTFDFRCNARTLAVLVSSLRAGGIFSAPVERDMLVGFSAGGLSSLLAANAARLIMRACAGSCYQGSRLLACQ